MNTNLPLRKARGRLWRACAEAPFQVPLSLFLGIVGVLSVLSGQGGLVPASIDVTLPLWLIPVWTFGLGAGGATAFVGRVAERDVLEATGLVGMAYGGALYAGVLIDAGGISAMTASLAFIAVAAGSVIRLRVLALDRKARREATRRMRGE